MGDSVRLIDAEALREDWLENGENEYIYSTNDFLYSIDEAPTVDPVRHERWVECGDGLYKCTGEGCTHKATRYERLTWLYCPHCGARMDGGQWEKSAEAR